MILLWVVLAALACSVIGTAILRRYAISRGILDIPNARSSHRVPTPRGGGLAIVVTFLAAVIVLGVVRIVRVPIAIALVGAGAAVACIGFVDDHRPIAARWRLLTHFAAAAWALAWLGGLPHVVISGRAVDLGAAGDLITTVALVWLLNLYNFMDGIDGIAGIEAVSVCLGAGVLYATTGEPRAELALTLALGASALGFLFWNFPPAKIFMGDAGSGFLGITIGILALQGARLSPLWLWSWTILLGVFVADATVTLLRRLKRGERLHEAHRSHGYQRAAIRIGRHRPVTVAVVGINLIWLLPWAIAVGTGRVRVLLGLTIAYLPLILIALWLDAGAQASSPDLV